MDAVIGIATTAALGVLGAVLSIVADPPPTTRGRIAVLIAGFGLPPVATPPTVEYLNLSPSWAAFAAVFYGISAIGLIKFAQMVGRDPVAAIRLLWPIAPREPHGGEGSK